MMVTFSFKNLTSFLVEEEYNKEELRRRLRDPQSV